MAGFCSAVSLTFRCNDICEYLKLPEFELYETEKESQCREEIEKSLTRIQTEVPVTWFLSTDCHKFQKNIATRRKNIPYESNES